MSEINYPNPHLVGRGRVRGPGQGGDRRGVSKVVAISNGRAHLLNLKTNRTSMSRPRPPQQAQQRGSHGYLRVERAQRPDGLERPGTI